MKIPKLLTLLILTTAALSTLPVARAQTLLDKPATSFASLPVINAEDVRQTFRSLELSKVGDGLAQKGDWKKAQSYYQDALNLWKDNSEANYGMADCYQVLGDRSKEVDAYRAAIYSTNPAVKGFREVHADKLMSFALLLAQTGRTEEAVYVYQHSADGLNYMDGKPHLKVMLPTFGNGEGQVPYTPELLQAMAHVGLAVNSQDDTEKLAHLDAAIRLQPDMPQAYFYKGETLWGEPHRDREALAAYRTARRLSYVDTQLVIDQVMEATGVEKLAALEQAREKQKADMTPGAGAAK